MAGTLFETFVDPEILKIFSNVGKDYRIYVACYRGKDKWRSILHEGCVVNYGKKIYRNHNGQRWQ